MFFNSYSCFFILGVYAQSAVWSKGKPVVQEPGMAPEDVIFSQVWQLTC
jgi:hypothetical protein